MSRPGYIKIANDIGASDEALAMSDDSYLAGVGLFVLCLGYCDRQLTDGHIPTRAMSRVIAPGLDCDAVLDELERVDLLRPESGGWVIPGYLKWQRSREQVEAASNAASNAAGSRWRNAEGNAKGNAKGNADRNAKGNAEGNANRNATGNAKELDRQIDTEDLAREVKPVDNSRKSKRGPVPDIPLVPVTGPIKRLVGVERIPEALDETTDLNHAIRRYLAAVDEFVTAHLGELHGDRLATARDRCRYEALDRIRTDAKNPAAYLTAAAGNATCLGDLVGDDLVTELRQGPKRRRKSEPKHVSEVAPC